MSPDPLRSKFVWMDGKLVPYEQANLHILNHSLHYGSAIFEGIRFYKTSTVPSVFRLTEHVNRFFGSAKTIQMQIPYSVSDIISGVIELIKSNELTAGYIRPIGFFGGYMELLPQNPEVHVAIAAWPWKGFFDERAVTVKTSSLIRLHPDSIFHHAKISGYYSNSILAGIEAHKAGYDEALLLDFQGNVAEGPGENIFMVSDDKIYTPDLGSILPGITRDSIIKISRDLGYKVQEKKISLDELKKADECFFTGTAVEITAIGKIDDAIIGKGVIGPITKILKEKFARVVRADVANYREWLTFAN